MGVLRSAVENPAELHRLVVLPRPELEFCMSQRPALEGAETPPAPPLPPTLHESSLAPPELPPLPGTVELVLNALLALYGSVCEEE